MFERDVTKEQRIYLVQKYKDSGLSKSEFADKFGLSTTLFESWIKDEKKDPNEIVHQEQQFV